MGKETENRITELNLLNEASLEKAKLESDQVEKSLKDQIGELKSICQQKSSEYEELTNKLNAKKCEYAELNERMIERENDLKNMKATTDEKLQEIAGLNNEVTFITYAYEIIRYIFL